VGCPRRTPHLPHRRHDDRQLPRLRSHLRAQTPGRTAHPRGAGGGCLSSRRRGCSTSGTRTFSPGWPFARGPRAPVPGSRDYNDVGYRDPHDQHPGRGGRAGTTPPSISRSRYPAIRSRVAGGRRAGTGWNPDNLETDSLAVTVTNAGHSSGPLDLDAHHGRRRDHDRDGSSSTASVGAGTSASAPAFVSKSEATSRFPTR